MIGNLILALGISICAGAGILKQNDIAQANIKRAYYADVAPIYNNDYTDISNGVGATYSQSNSNSEWFFGRRFNDRVRVFSHLDYTFDFTDLVFDSSNHNALCYAFSYADNNSINLSYNRNESINLSINVNNTNRYSFGDTFVNSAFFNDYYYDTEKLFGNVLPYVVSFDASRRDTANIVISYPTNNMNFYSVSEEGYSSFGYAYPNFIRVGIRDLDAENFDTNVNFVYRFTTYKVNSYWNSFKPSANDWSTFNLNALSYLFPLNYGMEGSSWDNSYFDLTGACYITYPFGFFGHRVELSFDVLSLIEKSGSSYFEEGYSTGYNDGYNTGKTEGYNQGLQSGYANGYAEGLNAYANNQGAIGLFGAIADTPIRFLKQMFSFELFGMNMAAIILSCLSAVVVFGLIKKIWK